MATSQVMSCVAEVRECVGPPLVSAIRPEPLGPWPGGHRARGVRIVEHDDPPAERTRVAHPTRRSSLHRLATVLDRQLRRHEAFDEPVAVEPDAHLARAIAGAFEEIHRQVVEEFVGQDDIEPQPAAARRGSRRSGRSADPAQRRRVRCPRALARTRERTIRPRGSRRDGRAGGPIARRARSAAPGHRRGQPRAPNERACPRPRRPPRRRTGPAIPRQPTTCRARGRRPRRTTARPQAR